MKTKILIMTFALCAAGLTAMAGQPSDKLASASLQKKFGIQMANPFAPAKVADNNGKIDRLGGMSSRPWSQTVGWHPGETSPEMDAKVHEPQLHLFWIGAEPQP